MPAYVAHIMFGNAVKQELEKRGFPHLPFIAEHPTAYHWGAQGPDILFFRNGNKKGPNPLGDCGGTMHKQKNPQVLANAGAYLAGVQGKSTFPAAASFVYGFLCHYGLDSNIHPYVYFMQEKRRGTYHSSVPYGIHMKLETDMDTALYTHLQGGDVRRYKQNPRWVQDAEDMDAVCNVQSWLLRQTFGEDYSPEFIRPCIVEAYKKEETMFDPTGIRSYLISRFHEIKNGEKNTKCANCRPKRVDYDILNLRHATWYNFRLPGSPRTDSVPEVFDAAVLQTADLAEELYQSLEKGVGFAPAIEGTFDDGNPDMWGLPPACLQG